MSRARRAALALACALGLGGAMLATTAPASAGAAATASGRSMVVHERVARTGNYVVILRVAAVPAAESVELYVGNHHETGQMPAGQATSFAFYVHLASTRFAVRTVGQSARLPFTVAAARIAGAVDSNGPTGATGASGLIGATGATGATGTDTVPGVHVYNPAQGPYNKLAWSDEFNGPAGTPPNPTNWGEDLDGDCGPGTLSSTTADPANAELDGQGNLAITALDGPSGYTSAQLNSGGLFSFEYGEIEARIELPVGSGLCSAFWMVGDSATQPCFPQCGEIDIMEAISQYPNWAFATLHGPVTGSFNDQQWEQYVVSSTPLVGHYHTYGLIWSPNKLTWTLDGVPYASATPQSLPAAAQWVFNGDPFHLIFDTAVGGWPGNPAAGAVFPATMRVAWVRLYG